MTATDFSDLGPQSIATRPWVSIDLFARRLLHRDAVVIRGGAGIWHVGSHVLGCLGGGFSYSVVRMLNQREKRRGKGFGAQRASAQRVIRERLRVKHDLDPGPGQHNIQLSDVIEANKRHPSIWQSMRGMLLPEGTTTPAK